MSITLQDCPLALREAVDKEVESLSNFGKVLTLAVSCRESTIYKDKSVVTKTHRVLRMAANVFITLRHMEDSDEKSELFISKDSLNIGEVKEIFEAAPSLVGFADFYPRVYVPQPPAGSRTNH